MYLLPSILSLLQLLLLVFLLQLPKLLKILLVLQPHLEHFLIFSHHFKHITDRILSHTYFFQTSTYEVRQTQIPLDSTVSCRRLQTAITSG